MNKQIEKKIYILLFFIIPMILVIYGHSVTDKGSLSTHIYFKRAARYALYYYLTWIPISIIYFFVLLAKGYKASNSDDTD